MIVLPSVACACCDCDCVEEVVVVTRSEAEAKRKKWRRGVVEIKEPNRAVVEDDDCAALAQYRRGVNGKKAR